VKPVPTAGVRRLLFVRPRFLGDVCLTLPAVDAALAACPGARAAYVTEAPLVPLLEGDARFAEVIAVPPRPSAGETLALVRRLRAFAPDVTFDFFCNPRSAVWTRASGARVRVGYQSKGWRSALYTHHARPRTLSSVRFHLASVEALGWPVVPRDVSPRLAIRDAARAEARVALAALGVSDCVRLLGMHPGARWPTRRWAPERFAALAAHALEAHDDLVVLVTAGPGEGEMARAVLASLPEARAKLVESWPLARFVALQSLCDVFVCGDTGPVHSAVAAGTSTLGLLSRNRPAMFFPYPAADGHRAYSARVECSPCDRDSCPDLRCLHRLTVDGAWAILAEMLAGVRAAGVAR
jgi:lipopolysaccharide heptosyltransferase II